MNILDVEIRLDTEIVWAKVKGYSWWPAIVTITNPSTTYSLFILVIIMQQCILGGNQGKRT